MSYPILEHDPTREAFIEPSNVINPRDMPDGCVICFFKDVIEKVVEEHNGKMLVKNRWEDGPHPIYEINYKDQRLALFHPGVGSAQAAALLEEVIAFGCQKFIACGGCGVLVEGTPPGQLMVVVSAVRDEGVSYHYLPPSREIRADERGTRSLIKLLKERDIPYLVGKTWTTDAPYRETLSKIKMRKEEGCLSVEMEAAGLMAVAQFRDVVYAQLLYAGDDLSGEKWDNRNWQSLTDIREFIFWLCADAVLSL
jgi:uridine phosphorylase